MTLLINYKYIGTQLKDSIIVVAKGKSKILGIDEILGILSSGKVIISTKPGCLF